jgi:hypothetical protein
MLQRLLLLFVAVCASAAHLKHEPRAAFTPADLTEFATAAAAQGIVGPAGLVPALAVPLATTIDITYTAATAATYPSSPSLCAGVTANVTMQPATVMLNGRVAPQPNTSEWVAVAAAVAVAVAVVPLPTYRCRCCRALSRLTAVRRGLRPRVWRATSDLLQKPVTGPRGDMADGVVVHCIALVVCLQRRFTSSPRRQ